MDTELTQTQLKMSLLKNGEELGDSGDRGPDIKELAKEWLRIDRDAETRQQIYRLLHENKKDELENRLRNRIAFGTAGLRARMEAGFSRMNSVTVIQTSQGLAAYLLQTLANVKHKGVVIGRDARHNSEKFAKLAAATFVAKGIKVWWLEPEVSTPLVPFGVRELHAAAGIMITASHNPPHDNGYKVYWENGCQIIFPYDKGIAAAIEQNAEPLEESWNINSVEQSLLVEGSIGLIADAYYGAVMNAADPKGILHKSQHVPNFAYTPLHGVGLTYMKSALKTIGIENHMTKVEQQATPDPDFPSVKFPNPEEEGALDIAIRVADEHNLSLILASDPDADRLAVAEKLPKAGWKQFSGNQLGILFASHILDTYNGNLRDKLGMLSSTVSSRMLSVMAAKEGFKHIETLTGFKWMGNVAIDLEKQGYDIRFAFEEAIGYMFPDVVCDKDSIAAAAVFLAACARWMTEEGLSPWEKLQQLYAKYGYFEDANTYLVSDNPLKTKLVFDRVRRLGSPFPRTLGHRRVLKWRDLTKGWDSETSDHQPSLPVDESSQMITCEVEGDVRFTVRGSGTEPKIKFYIECRAENSEEAKKGANGVLRDLLLEWFKPGDNGLRLAGSTAALGTSTSKELSDLRNLLGTT